MCTAVDVKNERKSSESAQVKWDVTWILIFYVFHYASKEPEHCCGDDEWSFKRGKIALTNDGSGWERKEIKTRAALITHHRERLSGRKKKEGKHDQVVCHVSMMRWTPVEEAQLDHRDEICYWYWRAHSIMSEALVRFFIIIINDIFLLINSTHQKRRSRLTTLISCEWLFIVLKLMCVWELLSTGSSFRVTDISLIEW